MRPLSGPQRRMLVGLVADAQVVYGDAMDEMKPCHNQFAVAAIDRTLDSLVRRGLARDDGHHNYEATDAGRAAVAGKVSP